MKKLIYIVLLLSFVSFGCVKDPVVFNHEESVEKWEYQDKEVDWKPYSKTIIRQAKRNKKPVLLYFTSTECKGCALFSQRALINSDVIDLINDKFTPVRVNQNSEKFFDIALKYGVDRVPTILVFNLEGNPMIQMSGAVPADTLMAHLLVARIMLVPNG